MATNTNTTEYASQIHGVNTSSIPTATMVKTDFDAGTSQLTGYIYGGEYNELETPVNGRADLAAFKVAALAAIEADFATRYVNSVLSVLDFTIEIDGANVIAGALIATVTNFYKDETLQAFSFLGLVFDANLYVLANALFSATASAIAPPTTLLAQQGRQPLQIS